MFTSRVISDKGLEELQYYKYHSSDASPLNKYVMNPFWTWLIDFFPLWIAPNTITLVGFIYMLAATAWAAYENPSFHGDLTTGCVLFAIWSVFVYQTLDALDGKQARRTVNSTPLGQLFDHGCDAVSMCCFCMLGGLMTRLGPDNPIMLAYFLLGQVAFFLAQWEEYWTGTIELGAIGITEGQFVGIGLFVFGGLFGAAPFKRLTSLSAFGYTFNGGECFLLVCIISFVSTMATNAVRVWKATPQPAAKRQALVQLLPLTLLTLAFIGWVRFSPANVAVSHPVALLVAAGLMYPSCVERMVVCRLTKDPVPLVYPFTAPIFAGFLQAVFIGNAEYDRWLVLASAVMGPLAYVQFAWSVIFQITNYFDIAPFRINRPLVFPLKTRPTASGDAAPTPADASSTSTARAPRGKSRTRAPPKPEEKEEAASPARRSRSRSRSAKKRTTARK